MCPACATPGGSDERFCSRCAMLLTYAEVDARPLSEREERARKVSPQYGEGELVKVGWARNQPEAELICGMLLEEGIPSVTRRSGGFDVPDYLAAGPRDILVAASGADAARDVLDAVVETPARSREPTAAWVRALALVLVIVTVTIVFAGVINALTS